MQVVQEVVIPRPGSLVYVKPQVGELWQARVVSYMPSGDIRVKSAHEGATHVQAVSPQDIFVGVGEVA